MQPLFSCLLPAGATSPQFSLPTSATFFVLSWSRDLGALDAAGDRLDAPALLTVTQAGRDASTIYTIATITAAVGRGHQHIQPDVLGGALTITNTGNTGINITVADEVPR